MMKNPMMIFFSSAEEQHRIQTKISYTKIIIFFVKSISRIFFGEKWNAWTPTRRQKKLSFRSLITVNVEDRSQLKNCIILLLNLNLGPKKYTILKKIHEIQMNF